MEKKSFEPTDMWERNLLLIGQEKFSQLQRATVTVIGVGGVGSAAVHARSGIGFLRLMDPKTIEASTLNRHVCATWADIGKAKVDVLSRFIKQINPLLNVFALQEFFVAEKHGDLVLKGSDYVIDCIDDVKTKVGLLEYCVKNNIPVISCMAAATRVDPTHVTVGDISTTRNDPLSTHVRKELHKREIDEGILCVYSVEPPVEGLAHLSKEMEEQMIEEHKRKKEELNEKVDFDDSNAERKTDSIESNNQLTNASKPTKKVKSFMADAPFVSCTPLESISSTKSSIDSELPTSASRVRILPSTMVVPTIFGVTAAGEVLMALSGFEHHQENMLAARHRGKSLAVSSREREKQTCVALARVAGVKPSNEAISAVMQKKAKNREEWKIKRASENASQKSEVNEYEEIKDNKETMESEKETSLACSSATPEQEISFSSESTTAPSSSIASSSSSKFNFYLTPEVEWLTPQIAELLLSQKVWGGQSALTPPLSSLKRNQEMTESKTSSESTYQRKAEKNYFSKGSIDNRKKGSLVLMRWDCSKPFSAQNAVLMTTQEAKLLQTDCFMNNVSKETVFGSTVVDKVNHILEEIIPKALT
ncbi:putative tRNA threonylcarbamoyladenosine dehydratase [Monocercomonoides exilis]|uniref:putative tRNA threonylcarbamoyladenosine dehydratase n=1 Tax=Monocercomonoides exilis TaxID=2049356 RepID=UPI003559D8DB|nr:putative tRNA threonylcarbamoyladenosine dehydratase [Monocercomonoides exilis]|eukprot:MONOS_2185.1-p1 / transcript=MONOS_2185.1 / gene=MONOS_2185 / organism=Monocercomonoides_exilis_PA203 / gene_product=UBA / transcript_product=UBA / location=Mono_scaffold00043:98410-100377(-) / protein_length=592 / sequence_SO=supercontig / SO=protein_coding / is_pseudo=false